MKIYLWGGRNPDGWEKILNEARNCARQIFEIENTKQVLHIPFARIWITKKNRAWFFPKEFSHYLEWLWISYLNATFIEDIESFNWDTIYINWWGSCEFLLQMCKNEKLAEAISKAKVIIWESCGSMILCEYLRDDLTKSFYVKWLWYIKDTIVEPHYTESHKEERLKKWMNINNLKYWLWIDENTFIEYENGKYWKKIWFWNVYYF